MRWRFVSVECEESRQAVEEPHGLRHSHQLNRRNVTLQGCWEGHTGDVHAVLSVALGT